MRILVVDDSPVDFMRCKNALEQLGYSDCVHLQNPTDIHQKIKAYKPDLIILDIVMPDQDGFETLRKLVSSGFDKPIIMYTSKNQASDKQYALALGATDYLAKPISTKALNLSMEGSCAP